MFQWQHHIEGLLQKNWYTHWLLKYYKFPDFFNVEMSTPNFAPTQVFYLVDNMLEGKAPMPSLEVAQAITKPSMEEELSS